MRTFWSAFAGLGLMAVVVLVPVTLFASAVLRESMIGQVRDALTSQARLAVTAIRNLPAPPQTEASEASGVASAALPVSAPGNRQMADVINDFGRITGYRFTAIDADGRVLAETDEDAARFDSHHDREEVAAALRGEIGQAVRESAILGGRWLYVAAPVSPETATSAAAAAAAPAAADVFGGAAPLAVVRASVSLAVIDGRVADLRRRLMGAMALALGAAGLAAWFLARVFSTPLEKIAADAARLAKGELDRPAAPGGTRETHVLARHFNHLAAELAERLKTIEGQRDALTGILAGMDEGVLALDEQRRVTSANRAAAALFGLTESEMEGKPLQAVCRSAALLELFDSPAADIDWVEGEIILPGASAACPGRSIQARLAPSMADAKNGRHRLLLLRDLTHVRRLETARRDFAHNVSHELRTPVTSIQGYLETLAGMLPPGNREGEYIDVALRNTRRLGRIISDLLTLADIESGRRNMEKEQMPLRAILEEASFAAGRPALENGGAVDIDCGEDLVVPANASLLERAVANLVDNAVKYGPRGGRLRVVGRLVEGWAEIKIHDEGDGIPPEHLDRLFERFYRVDAARSRETGGTGLGLAVVRHIAQAHGGETGVESVVGRGSVFTIRIPAR